MRFVIHKIIFCGFVLIGSCWLTGCDSQTKTHNFEIASGTAPPSTTQSLTHVTLALNWFPEMEHGGFFAAQIDGNYQRAGVEVEIIPGGAGTQVIPQVAAERVDFGIDNADNLVLARAQGIPVIALMAPIQTSPRCIIVHEKSGIQNLSELKNVTLAINLSNPFAVFLQKNFPLTGVRIVPYQGSTAQFLIDPNYAQQGYLFSEPYIIRQKGGDPRSLLLADAGFNPYTSVLITSEEKLQNQPQAVRALARASAEGWERYMADARPANEHIHELNPQMGLDILKYGAQTLHDVTKTSETLQFGLGIMTRQRWAELIDKMEHVGLIERGKVKPDDCFDGSFLKNPARY